MSTPIRVALVTVSDGVFGGQRQDHGGPACEGVLAESGIDHRIVSREVLPDDRDRVARAIREQADGDRADLVVLTGGTGVSPRDRTPEAVREVISFEIPGLAEKMRAETGAGFPAAYLSRQLAGVRHRTIVLALPGSPRGAADCLRAVTGLIPHAVALVRGEAPPHPQPSGASE